MNPVFKLLHMPASVSLLLIRAYQLTRFLRQPSCRFYPSCSQYTATSVERFGFCRGLFAGGLRIARCHPFHPGGIDEVPEQFSEITNASFDCIPGMRGSRARGNG